VPTEGSAVEINEAAAMLDYASANAFSRAFRRWSGRTPSEWRVARGAVAGKRGAASL